MSTKSTKTTATKTNATAKNATATATAITVNDVYKVFIDNVNGRVCKLNFSDAKSQPYCGYDDFSVNMKKSSYNVYMNEVNANLCLTVDDSLTVELNACDTTKKQLRNRLVRFTDFDVLKKCIAVVTENRFATNN